MRYCGSDGKAHTGWLVTDTYKDYGLQRYWFGSDGVLAVSRLVSKSEAGWWAYATKRGYVARGRCKAGKLVYLADNDGRLEDAGWVVSDSYGQGLQRYWVDSAKHAAVAGFSKDGWAHCTTSKGYVLRGKKRVGDGMLLADNDGVLVENIAKEGWLVTDKYDGELQRYRIDDSCNGHLGAHLGYFTIGKKSYYGRYDQGYVVRNVVYKAPDGNRYYGDNDGVLKPLRTGAYRRSDGSYDWYNSNGDCDRAGAINKILSTAYSLLGVPYVWLGVYPQDGGMDCASFTWYLYKQLGIDIGFETYDQMYSGVAVSSLSDAKPGDLILMYDNGWPNCTPGLYEHVVLYAGDGMIYEEPTFGGQCQYVSLSSKGASNLRIRRIIAD